MGITIRCKEGRRYEKKEKQDHRSGDAGSFACAVVTDRMGELFLGLADGPAALSAASGGSGADRSY